MKKFIFLLIFAMAICNLHITGQTVQGFPHELGNSDQTTVSVKTVKNVTSDFTFDDVKFWVGEGENEALMIIDFHIDEDDGKTGLVWGYRWPVGETATGLDMITAIAKADPRFLVMVQETNLGYTIDAIGFGPLRKYFNIEYDLDGASTDSKVSFKFDYPNTFLGQNKCPENPLEEISAAIDEGIETGVLDHPFNFTNYGYACYDYDHWSCDDDNVDWQSGWYIGYWSYLVKDNINDDFGYSGVGAILRELQNGSVDSWGYQEFTNPSYTGVAPREPYVAVQPMVLIDDILTSSETTIEKGSSFALSYSIHPVSATTQKPVWSSDNETVASVDNEGVVSAIGEGTAIITASIEGEDIIPFSYTINVEKAIVAIEQEVKNQLIVSVNKGTLHITGCKGYSFDIYDLNGQIVKSFTTTEVNSEHGIYNLKGIFILKGNNGSSSVIRKIIF